MTRSYFLRVLAVVLVLAAVGIAAYVAFASTKKIDQNMVFSSHTLLTGTWDTYKEEYWEASTGRTLDKQQNEITTSEGQSYTMLRAVWMSDKPTFDKAWAWTKEQLQRDDQLFAWRWGQKGDGSYGVLEEVGGQNSASDADADIALALLMAAGRWQEQGYLSEAKSLIKAIWDYEVIEINGRPYLASNNLEKQSQAPAVMNPSYLAPYAYREFAKADSDHDWNAVVDSSYDLLQRSAKATLGDKPGVGLVPDWVHMDRTTGELSTPDTETLTSNYSFDAMRTVWRLGVDYRWNGEKRAKELLDGMHVLAEEWQKNGAIYSTYAHDGSVLKKEEVAEAYGTSLAYFDISNPSLAEDVYEQKIATLYDQNTNSWKQPLTYYASNWLWFGIALHENQLPNLVEDLDK